MRRRTLDALLTTGGAVVTVILLVAAGLLFWAASFAKDSVSQQLSDQRITMPSGKAIEDPAIKPFLAQYAGQPMTTGAQAKAYADYYIQAHMDESSEGKTYSQISGEYMKSLAADPTSQATTDLGQLRQSLFMGTTLRGMLLNAYAFATLGTIGANPSPAAIEERLKVTARDLGPGGPDFRYGAGLLDAARAVTP